MSRSHAPFFNPLVTRHVPAFLVPLTLSAVRDDAVHFILEFEHAEHSAEGWEIHCWDLVDLFHFQVILKTGFRGSNRGMYWLEAMVATGTK